MLTPNEINEKLEQYKDCKQIRIKTIEGKFFDINYVDIINYPKDEYIFVKALFAYDERLFLYCAISDILPVY